MTISEEEKRRKETVKLQRINRVWILTINGIEYKFNNLEKAIEAIRERKGAK